MRRYSNDFITTVQDMRDLRWSNISSSSGTNGCFLKAVKGNGGRKTYYKLSNYDSVRGFFGHESVNELVVSRILDILHFDHVKYRLIHCTITIDNKDYVVWLCSSQNFRKRGESKIALDTYYALHKNDSESILDFCERCGWIDDIYKMILVDYLTINRDRHGANIEVLVDSNGNARLAPLFDHGISFVSPYFGDEKLVSSFDAMADKMTNNYIGSRFHSENLNLIVGKLRIPHLSNDDIDYVFRGIDKVLPLAHVDKMREILVRRWAYYEEICNCK